MRNYTTSLSDNLTMMLFLQLFSENDELDVTESRASSNHTEKALPPAPSSPTSPSRTLLGRLSPSRKQSEEAADLELHTPLATLIHGRRWDKVIARLAANPLEAENELKVVTRGGFTAVRGMTPLHYACERKPPAEVVHCLIEAYPAALGVQAVPGGALPLHIACTWGASDEVVIALLSADSGTARATDELGNVALHAACFSGASVEVVTTLLEVYEKGILARNTQGSRAIDIVRRLRQKNRASMVNLLARRKDDLLGVHHRRDNSSSAWSLCESAADASVSPEFVREGEHALEIGYRTGDALQDDHGGVEITYQEADGSQNDEQNASDGEDLVWI
jgi:ankyrin repeat protein